MVVIGLLVGGFLMFSSNDSTDNTKSTKEQTSSNTQQKETQEEKISLEDAISTIGMDCKSSGAIESECTWNGKKYTLTKPSDWSKDESLRNQACDQGYINANYQILSDGSSFHFTTDFNEDLPTLETALNDASIDAKVIPYCG